MLLTIQWCWRRQSTHWLTYCLREIAFETVTNTLAQQPTLVHVYTSAHRGAEVEVKTLSDTVVELEGK